MSTATVAAPALPVVSGYPDPISLPVAPKGDPLGVRLLADAYPSQADRLAACGRQLTAICTDLGDRWHGHGSAALHTPLQVISGNLHQLVAGYRNTADALDHYADALHHAQHHHGWSLGRIAAVGAIITVTAVAVVITVGAAAPVGTLAAVEVGEAIAGAEAAVATATAAQTTAITALTTTGLNVSLTALRAVALRQLTAGAINTTLDLGLHGITGHPITGRDIALDMVTGTTAGATVDATRTALHATEAWCGLSTLGQAALDTTALTTTLTTDDALHQYETTGHLNPTQLTETALLAAVLPAGRTGGERPTRPPVAVVPTGGAVPTGQTIAELMRDGVRLDQHEGPYPLGHVLDRHVGMTDDDLEARLLHDPNLRAASTFTEQETAELAITHALQLRPNKLAQVAATPGAGTDFPVDVHWKVGRVMTPDGAVVASSIVHLKIVNVGSRIVVRTAFVAQP